MVKTTQANTKEPKRSSDSQSNSPSSWGTSKTSSQPAIPYTQGEQGKSGEDIFTYDKQIYQLEGIARLSGSVQNNYTGS